jgi:diguanylate cyclase (GGDEF)-like protein
VVSRLGGDEFVIVAEEVRDAHGATEIARRLLAACDAPIDAAGRRLQVSPSIGVALSDGTADAEELLRLADAAMYRAKERGRGTFEILAAPTA